MTEPRRACAFLALLFVASLGCGSIVGESGTGRDGSASDASTSRDASVDTHTTRDTGTDVSHHGDSGGHATPDAGHDSSPDGTNPDATPDSGSHPLPDSSLDSSHDAAFSLVATLADLTTTAGALSPAFSPTTLGYTTPTVLVPYIAATPGTVTVTATTTDPNATLTINGIAVASGVPSGPITVPFGASTVAVVVTAADGVTKDTYTVALNRTAQEAYVKASNASADHPFGDAVALSADGNTMAVGADSDSSDATGINGNAFNTSMLDSGAVHVFTRSGNIWSEQAYIKASNTAFDTEFGWSVALSADGNTLAVGSDLETSDATGVNGDQSDTSAKYAGAVYLFTRSGATWSQVAYVKASNTRAYANFGFSVALSGDGSTLAVGAQSESSDATGIDGDQSDTSMPGAGAVYVFTLTGTTWSQEAYVKASNTNADDELGFAVALSSDGNTLAVGAPFESSDATGINGNQMDTSASEAGAAYVFTRSGSTWSQEAYVKASNASANSAFGSAIALSSDGDTLAAGAPFESSDATGINGDQSDTSQSGAGAAYVFSRSGTTWSQEAYVKASNTFANAMFGGSLALSGDGSTLAVGAAGEASDATVVDGNQSNTSDPNAGAVYVFTGVAGAGGTVWTQGAYVKESNTGTNQHFGGSVALSGDGTTLACSAVGDGDFAGAVFVFQ